MKKGYDMLYLTSCALHNEKPDSDKIKNMNMEKLLKVCKFHSLTAIVAYALESAGIKQENFQKEKSLAIRNIMLLDTERNQICQFLEENKIWYMPLKGVYLKEYYPKIGMRQMCDNDILIEESAIKTVNRWMIERGYEVPKNSEHEKNHDYEYLKKPCYNYEIHFSLFAKIPGNPIYEYYKNIRTKLIKDADNNYGYHFSSEDFYIYMIAHEFGHFYSGGTGLRSLVDTYVYLRKFSDTMDWKYIEQECLKLEIAEYEEKSRALAIKVFSSTELPVLTDDEKEMLEYYLAAGTYGTTTNAAAQKMKKFEDETGSTSKFRYLLHRIFPPMETYRLCFPFFYKHKILLPIGWVYRLFRGIFCKQNIIKSEMNAINQLKGNRK